jgi:hypothetical protein
MKKRHKKFLKIITENKPGKLDNISKILAQADIDIKDFVAVGIDEKGLIFLHTSDQDKALEILQGNGYYILEENGIIIKLESKPGALAKITDILSKKNININSAATIDRNKESTFVALTVDDASQAKKILKNYTV